MTTYHDQGYKTQMNFESVLGVYEMLVGCEYEIHTMPSYMHGNRREKGME